MASLTFATIKIATKEEMDNTFVIDFFRSINPEKTSYIRGYEFPEERDYVIINYTPSFNFDIYDLVEELSKHFPHTFSTIGHSYGNMQPTTVEYIVVYKNGEIIFEGDYPLVVFDESGKMNDEGEYPIDKEATKAILDKLEVDKKECFPTFYEKIEKLTEKEKRLLYSAIKFLCLTGYCDFDDEDCEEMNGKELKKRSAVRLKIILTKILGKGCSCYDSKEEDAE